MTPNVAVKICGLREKDQIDFCVDAGVRYIGLNFYAPSPRSVTFEQAVQLADAIPVGVAKVALVVNETDAFLDDLIARVPLDMIQLHGKEPPDRVREIRARYGLPVIKAIGLATPDDLPQLDVFEEVADQLLVDAKPAKGDKLPGGNGHAFDWSLLRGRKYWRKPWLLAGGLTPETVADAIRQTGARQVDVSSGVESAPGDKNGDRVQTFIRETRKS